MTSLIKPFEVDDLEWEFPSHRVDELATWLAGDVMKEFSKSAEIDFVVDGSDLYPAKHLYHKTFAGRPVFSISGYSLGDSVHFSDLPIAVFDAEEVLLGHMLEAGAYGADSINELADLLERYVTKLRVAASTAAPGR